jgi:hypothetical protein
MRKLNIEKYEFGRIKIDGESYNDDVIILPSRVITNWWRKRGHEINSEDIEEILEVSPEVLIVGTGYYGMVRLLKDARERLTEIGCEIIKHKTQDACDVYNQLSKTKRVVAVLHLSC